MTAWKRHWKIPAGLAVVVIALILLGGDSRIIAYVTQSIVALIDWQMDMQSAFDLPRHVNRNGPTEIEEESALLTYVEERLGSRVFVSLDDIRQYYTATFEPAMKARGRTAPPLPEVREQIRAVLREQRLNEEIDRWTDELRIEADIDDFFDAPLDELPPHLLDTIEAEDGT